VWTINCKQDPLEWDKIFVLKKSISKFFQFAFSSLGFGSSLKNLLTPMDYLKNSPVKVKDLKLAMTVLPKLMPYVLV